MLIFSLKERFHARFIVSYAIRVWGSASPRGPLRLDDPRLRSADIQQNILTVPVGKKPDPVFIGVEPVHQRPERKRITAADNAVATIFEKFILIFLLSVILSAKVVNYNVIEQFFFNILKNID